jgi:hypothetical protein
MTTTGGYHSTLAGRIKEWANPTSAETGSPHANACTSGRAGFCGTAETFLYPEFIFETMPTQRHQEVAPLLRGASHEACRGCHRRRLVCRRNRAAGPRAGVDLNFSPCQRCAFRAESSFRSGENRQVVRACCLLPDFDAVPAGGSRFGTGSGSVGGPAP